MLDVREPIADNFFLHFFGLELRIEICHRLIASEHGNVLQNVVCRMHGTRHAMLNIIKAIFKGNAVAFAKMGTASLD